MAMYSHSKISTFENCPYQYKLKYIDKIEPEIPTTIEAFMGSMVHEALKKLYEDKKYQKEVSVESVLRYYGYLWEKEYSEDILVVKKDRGLTADHYRKMGEKFIIDYYMKYKPFNKFTILGLETQDRLTLPDGNQWHIRIDKLGCDNSENYYVCDYKTSSRMLYQEDADSDRQLAMYAKWVKDKFKDAKSVKLLWHMLAFNKEVISERNEQQLEKLQQDIMNKIKEVESATEFPTNVTALCNYCGYKSICPSFRHQRELESKVEVQQFKEDEGVKLVDEFAEIKNKLNELKEKEEDLKEKIKAFAEQKDVDTIYGSNMKAQIQDCDKIIMPEGEDKDKFIQLMKDKGIYEDCSMVCFPKLKSKILNGDIANEFKDRIDIIKDCKISLKKRDDIEDSD